MPSFKTITIFIASSSELKEERDNFRLFIAGLNDKIIDQQIYMKIIQWEHFLDSMSDSRLQDEYNKAIRQVDIVLCLFFTKVGKYTEEEFDTAFAAFKMTGRPKIWTYFKNANITTGTITEEIMTLIQFKKKLAEFGHFPTDYASTADLHNKFRDQLDRILPQLILQKRTEELRGIQQQPFNEMVIKLLADTDAICKQNNVPLQSPFIYAAILNLDKSYAYECLRRLSPGIANKVRIFFTKYAEDLCKKPTGIYEKSKWTERKEIFAANKFSINDGVGDINVKHLFLGLLNTASTSTLELQKILGAQYPLLLQVAQTLDHMSTLPPAIE